MKKGSGDDPFADLEEDTSEEPDSTSDPEGSGGETGTADDNTGAAGSGGAADAGSGSDSSTGSGVSASSTTTTSGSSTKERYTDSAGDRLDSSGSSTADRAADTADVSTNAGETSAQEAAASPDEGVSKAEADGIPWVLRRSRVKEDRENVHQFFLREEYSAREDEILEDVASELEMRQKDLQKLDVREAMVASADAEAIAAVLREWGYEYLK